MQVDLPRIAYVEDNPQRKRVRNGQDAEAMVRAAFERTNPKFICKLSPGGAGTPFDYLITYDNEETTLGVEVKNLTGYRMDRTMFTATEADGLTKFDGEKNRSLVMAVVTTPTRRAAYAIPWRDIPEAEPFDPSTYEWIPRKGNRLDMRDYIDTLRRGGTHADHHSWGDNHNRPDARHCGVGA